MSTQNNFAMCRVFAVLLLFALKSEISGKIVNLEVVSYIDLKCPLVTSNDVVLFINKSPKRVKTYTYVKNDSSVYSIRFLSDKMDELPFNKSVSTGLTYYDVALKEEAIPNEKNYLHCRITYANKMVPAYKTRASQEDQVMKFETTKKFLSVYYTKVSNVEFMMKGGSLREVSKTPTQVTNNSLTFVSRKVKKLDFESVKLTFVENDPLLVVTNLKRQIDISHFGKITIEDEVVVENRGTRYVGPFEHQSLDSRKKATTEWLNTYLPVSAHNIQFFDILGNNSLCAVFHFHNYITLKLATRYPLKGGWKGTYTLRYELPLHEYVFWAKDRFVLKIRAIDYVIDDSFIEKALIIIALPEGARIEEVKKPEILEFGEDVEFWSALGVFKRPMVVLNGSQLFDNYMRNVRVEYVLSPLYLLRAPMVIATYFECVLGFIIAGNRYFF